MSADTNLVTRWGFISEHLLDIRHFTREEQLILVHLSILSNPELRTNPKIVYSLLEERLGYERSVITRHLNKLAKKLFKITFPDCKLELTKKRDDYSSKVIFEFFYEFEKYSVRKITAKNTISKNSLDATSFSQLQTQLFAELLERGFDSYIAHTFTSTYEPDRILRSITYHENAKTNKPEQKYTHKHLHSCITHYEKWNICNCEPYDLRQKIKENFVPFNTAYENILKLKKYIPMSVRNLLSPELKHDFDSVNYNFNNFWKMIPEDMRTKIYKEFTDVIAKRNFDRTLPDFNRTQYLRAFMVFCYANDFQSAMHYNLTYDKIYIV